MIPAMPFALARRNFYRAARDGLERRAAVARAPGALAAPDAGRRGRRAPHPGRPRAASPRAGVDADEADALLDVMAERVTAEVTGARWQRAALAAHEERMMRGTALAATLDAYIEAQFSGLPVHRWPIPSRPGLAGRRRVGGLAVAGRHAASAATSSSVASGATRTRPASNIPPRSCSARPVASPAATSRDVGADEHRQRQRRGPAAPHGHLVGDHLLSPPLVNFLHATRVLAACKPGDQRTSEGVEIRHGHDASTSRARQGPRLRPRQGADPRGHLPRRRDALRGRGGRRAGHEPHAGARGLPAAGGRGPAAPLPQARRPGGAGLGRGDQRGAGDAPDHRAPLRRADRPPRARRCSCSSCGRCCATRSVTSERGNRIGFVEADRLFHRAIVSADGNSILTRLHDSLRERQRRMGAAIVARDPIVQRRYLDEHRAIVDALEAGGDTGPLLTEHLEGARRDYAPAGLCPKVDTIVIGFRRAPDALTINEAAATTGWSARMLRYIESIGLVAPRRSPAGYRLYGAAELQRLRTLRELLDRHGVALGEVGFARRLRDDRALAEAVEGWLDRHPGAPRRRRPPPTGCATSRTSTPACWPRPHRRPDGDRMTTTAPPAEADYKVADLALADFGRKEITPRRARDAGPHVHPRRVRRPAAARGRARHRLAAHDGPDGGAHRDPDRAGRRRCAGPRATSSPPRTTPPPRSWWATAPPRQPSGVPVYAWKGETLEEYWWCTEQGAALARRRRPQHDPRRRRRRDPAGAPGPRVRGGGRRPRRRHRRVGGVPRRPRPAAPVAARGPQALDPDRRRRQGRHRGDHHRRQPPLQAGREGRAAVPGDQRQRLGHQVEVRQPLRRAPLAGGRHQPRHRRDAGRQGRRGLRLRRRRQGLRRVAAPPRARA